MSNVWTTRKEFVEKIPLFYGYWLLSVPAGVYMYAKNEQSLTALLEYFNYRDILGASLYCDIYLLCWCALCVIASLDIISTTTSSHNNMRFNMW